MEETQILYLCKSSNIQCKINIVLYFILLDYYKWCMHMSAAVSCWGVANFKLKSYNIVFVDVLYVKS